MSSRSALKKNMKESEQLVISSIIQSLESDNEAETSKGTVENGSDSDSDWDTPNSNVYEILNNYDETKQKIMSNMETEGIKATLDIFSKTSDQEVPLSANFNRENKTFQDKKSSKSQKDNSQDTELKIEKKDCSQNFKLNISQGGDTCFEKSSNENGENISNKKVQKVKGDSESSQESKLNLKKKMSKHKDKEDKCSHLKNTKRSKENTETNSKRKDYISDDELSQESNVKEKSKQSINKEGKDFDLKNLKKGNGKENSEKKSCSDNEQESKLNLKIKEKSNQLHSEDKDSYSKNPVKSFKEKHNSEKVTKRKREDSSSSSSDDEVSFKISATKKKKREFKENKTPQYLNKSSKNNIKDIKKLNKKEKLDNEVEVANQKFTDVSLKKKREKPDSSIKSKEKIKFSDETKKNISKKEVEKKSFNESLTKHKAKKLRKESKTDTGSDESQNPELRGISKHRMLPEVIDAFHNLSEKAKDRQTLLMSDFYPFTVFDMRAALKLNDQTMEGTKKDLIKNIKNYVLNGCPPRCPNCKWGHLRFGKKKKKWCYSCPGFYSKHHWRGCSYTISKQDIELIPWKDP